MGPSEKDAACSSCRGAYGEKSSHQGKGSGAQFNSHRAFLFQAFPGHPLKEAVCEHGRRSMKGNWQRIREQVKDGYKGTIVDQRRGCLLLFFYLLIGVSLQPEAGLP